MVTVQTCVHLYWFFSTAVLPSVSAGGAYCAETARARAAALGLEYPGVYEAPDLSSPAGSLMNPRTFGYDDLPPSRSDVNFYEKYQLAEAPSDYPLHGQVHPMSSGWSLSSHIPFNEASRGHNADQMFGFPRGQSEFGLEEIKHDAPPTLAKAIGHSDPMNLHTQGRRKPLLFGHSKQNPTGDEAAPNSRGMPLTYQGRIHPKREFPILHSARLLHRRRGWAPMQGLWKVVRHSGPLAHCLPRIGGSRIVKGAILHCLRKMK